MNRDEQIYAIALSLLPHLKLSDKKELYDRFDSATALFREYDSLPARYPDISPKVGEVLRNSSGALQRAQKEMEYCEKHNIAVLPLNDPSYPQRLAECCDAPVVLYYKGNGNLNHQKILAIVGTRNNTTYGTDFLRSFLRDLRANTDVLIVSGLAYGIDINAHRRALDNGLSTVAILAHGLDMIYPRTHEDTADKMVAQGGLLTEYPINTVLDKRNFVQRNRIIAGIANAVLVVESKETGGALITAEIANSYNREVFAVPGKYNADSSKGCNNLIRDDKAALCASATDLLQAMRWEEEDRTAQRQQEGPLFVECSPDEQKIVELLQKNNDINADIIAMRTGLRIQEVSVLLFELELKHLVQPRAGGNYHLFT